MDMGSGRYSKMYVLNLKASFLLVETSTTMSMTNMQLQCIYVTVQLHIPREITCTCHFFIKSKGEITGEAEGEGIAQLLAEV